MKFNWGHGLTIAIIVSSLGFIFLVYKSTNQKIDLVTEDYYPKGLVYDKEIEKLKNASLLPEKVGIEAQQNVLLVKFPTSAFVDKKPKGTIYFYYPGAKEADKSISILVDSNNLQTIALGDFAKGKCEIRIDWQTDSVEYLQKESIFIAN